MKRIGVLTSGGDSPGMNAGVRAVVRTAFSIGIEVFGVKRGYQGLVEGDLVALKSPDVAETLQRGGTFLRTARSEDFMTEEGFNKALMVLDAFKIDGLVVIGGDGSMRGAKKLADAGIATVVIPGTIDNDMAYTDYTIGFDTAVNTAVRAIGNLRDTSSAHGRVTLIELMGRKCGDIALYAGIASGGDIILVPGVDYDMKDICRKIIESKNKGKLHCLVIVAEGAQYSCDELSSFINEHTGLDSRVTILGHVQRGGSPTAFDRVLASRLGMHAVKVLAEGKKSRAIGTNNKEIFDMDIDEALEAKRPDKSELIELGEVLAL